jgi:hypothetical protein
LKGIFVDAHIPCVETDASRPITQAKFQNETEAGVNEKDEEEKTKRLDDLRRRIRNEQKSPLTSQTN